MSESRMAPLMTDQPHTSEHLETGHLGRGQLVSLSLASFIPAVGMALVPVLLFSSAGMTSWLSALLGATAVIFVGLSVTRFARRFIASGSLYSYIGEVFGLWAQRLMAAALLAGFLAQVAGISGIVGIFVGSFLASLGLTAALGPWPQIAIYIVAACIAASIAYRGLDTSVRVAVTLAVLSVPLMMLITVASAAHTGLMLEQQLDFGAWSLSGTLQGMASGAAFLVAFESCSSLAAETKDAKRNVPLAVMAVPVVLGALYMVCTVLQIPGLAAASSLLEAGVSPPAALAIQSGLGDQVAIATDAVLAVATFGALIGFINYGARFAMTLGADRLLPKALASVHPRFHSPHIAIIVLTLLGVGGMSVLALIVGDVLAAYNAIATLLVYEWVLPYLLITAGAIVLIVREGGFRPGPIIASALGGIGMGWIFINGLINPPPAPYDSMSWVTFIAIGVLLAVITISRGKKWTGPSRTRPPQQATANETVQKL
jgi:amino acid transporter